MVPTGLPNYGGRNPEIPEVFVAAALGQRASTQFIRTGHRSEILSGSTTLLRMQPTPPNPPASRPTTAPFSSRVEVPPTAFEYHHTVREDELDGLNHVNNLEYMKWMLAAATAHSDSVGWTLARHLELQGGWVVRTHQIEYLMPAFVGDEVVVRTWVVDMKWMLSLRRYVLMRPSDNVRLAVAATNWAFIDFRTGKLTRIPTAVSSAFEVIPDVPA
jgi:acyl-CoA thioester hydrolase